MTQRAPGKPRHATILPLAALAAWLAATAACTPVGPPALHQACGRSAAYLATWEVQGSGHTSPYAGQRVDDVRGVVTADFQRGTGGPYEPGGFFIQAHEPDCNATTSDGLFVYTGPSPVQVAVGDVVEIDGGVVDEYRGPISFVWERTLTEIDCHGGCVVATLQAGYGRPAAEEYAPPPGDAEALAYNEAREGMLVQVAADCTVVAAANEYGEMVVLRGAGLDRLHEAAPPHGGRIVVDGDGIAAANCGQDGLGAVKTFDTALYRPGAGAAIHGPLTYGFDTYRVQQDDDAFCLSFTPGDDSSYDPADNPVPAAGPNTLTVAVVNAWNLFDADDDPYKDDDVPSAAEAARRSLKLADALCSQAGLNLPLVVGLQEMENEAVLQALVDDVAAACGAAYAGHIVPGPDDRGLDVAFLTRADRVTAVAVGARQGCSATARGVGYEPDDGPPGVTCGTDAPHYLHNRPPLHLEAQVTLGSVVRTVHLINNHWKSRLPSPACLEPDCADWRMEEARHVAGLVGALLADDPGALVAVMGDLNDGVDSAAPSALDGTLTNVWADLAGPPSAGQGSVRRYDYVYQGVAGVLDHLLVSSALAALPREVSVRHVNVDWPAVHLADASMFRSSDHDFLLAAFDLDVPAPAP